MHTSVSATRKFSLAMIVVMCILCVRAACVMNRLLSSDQEERASAFMEVCSGTRVDEECENILKGKRFINFSWNPFFGAREPIQYPLDVKKMAVSKLFEDGKELRLIEMMHNYQVKEDAAIVEYIYSVFDTPKGLLWAVGCDPNDFCVVCRHIKLEKSAECLVWAIHHETDAYVENNISLYLTSNGHSRQNRSTGVCIVEELLVSESALAAIAQDKSVRDAAKIAAAKKLLTRFQPGRDVVLATVNAINAISDASSTDMREVAEAGVDALKRIGENEDAQQMMNRFSIIEKEGTVQQFCGVEFGSGVAQTAKMERRSDNTLRGAFTLAKPMRICGQKLDTVYIDTSIKTRTIFAVALQTPDRDVCNEIMDLLLRKYSWREIYNSNKTDHALYTMSSWIRYRCGDVIMEVSKTDVNRDMKHWECEVQLSNVQLHEAAEKEAEEFVDEEKKAAERAKRKEQDDAMSLL